MAQATHNYVTLILLTLLPHRTRAEIHHVVTREANTKNGDFVDSLHRILR